jgi:hypothetical protein
MPTQHIDFYEYGAWREETQPDFEQYLLESWDGVVIRRESPQSLSPEEIEESCMHLWRREGWVMVRFVSEDRWDRGSVVEYLPVPALSWSTNELHPTKSYRIHIHLNKIGPNNFAIRIYEGRLFGPKWLLRSADILNRELYYPFPFDDSWKDFFWRIKHRKMDWHLPLRVRVHQEKRQCYKHFPIEFTLHPELADTLKELGLPEVLCSNPPPPDECLWVGYEGE